MAAPRNQTAAQAETTREVLVVVSARVGGVIVRDGTAVQALAGGRECASATTALGFAVLTIPDRATRPACSGSGVQLAFAVGDMRARETVAWRQDTILLAVALSVDGPGGASGRAV
ncbi:MAG: hypothetical protein U0531_16705 [Dehalococcoidia bacterium]